MAKSFIKITHISPSDKHYLYALVTLVGVIFFWRGTWEIMDTIPLIDNLYVSLFLGLLIMTFSGVIFREFNPEEEPLTPLMELMKDTMKHPIHKRKTYLVLYHDELTNKNHQIGHADILDIEHNYVIVEQQGREFFI